MLLQQVGEGYHWRKVFYNYLIKKNCDTGLRSFLFFKQLLY